MVCKKSAFKIFKFCKYWDIFAKEYGSAFKIELVAKKTKKSESFKKNLTMTAYTIKLQLSFY